MNWKFLVLLFLPCCFLKAQAPIKYADVVLDSYYSGANPQWGTFYGNNGLNDGCNLFAVPLNVCLGDKDSIIALPAGSYLTLGFTDNLIFDAEDQDDLFVEENGGGQEFGELFVSPDGINFTFLDTMNGAQVNSFDLADYAYDDVIKAVKIVGLDNGGCIPGFDLERVYGIEGANCPCGADLKDFDLDICTVDTMINLNQFVRDSSAGLWIGENVIDSVFNPSGLEANVILNYVVNADHPVCPSDTILFPVEFAECDCNDVLGGAFEVDSCGLCLDPSGSEFNNSCLDCLGEINGSARIDSCGVCLDTLDVEFNQSCTDCMGVVNGEHTIDLCENCLLSSDPLFNNTCPEILDIYIPNLFRPGSLDINNEFKILGSEKSIGRIVNFDVYNRWGSLVYRLEDKAVADLAESWNGRYNDKIVEQGVYSYKLVVNFGAEDEIRFGSILILR